ncbi:MAG: NAD(P)-dependent oxidoreductase [Desulfobacterales bacterium]|nr:NAD(P)-dependent oxidoreductase [Desulfobacterales bacterium]
MVQKRKGSSSKQTVGVIGTGNMGRGIALNLCRAGFPVAVWDANPDALTMFRGKKDIAILVPAEMAGVCSVIFFVVPASPQIDGLLKGKNGVLAHARKGLVLYDLTTSDPVYTKRLARRSGGKGIPYLDAGMSGGAAGATAGTLSLMVGGDKNAFGRTRKFLTPFADKIFYLGKSGSGHTLKLIHNMVLHTIFVATCEGGRMAERAGIALEDMIDVFNVSNARSYISQVRFPRHILTGKWDGGSRVYNLHKDVGMAVKLGKKLKADVAMGENTLAFLEKAMDHGMQDTDFTRLYREYNKIVKKA